MRKYIMVVFNLFLGVFMYISCTSINKSNEIGIKISNEDNEEIIMEELEYDLETIERMNSRFGGYLTKYIEVTDNYEIIIHYKNESNETYLIPKSNLHPVDTRLDSDLMYRGVINEILNIEDSLGNNLVVKGILIDYNIYHIITEDECLRMLPGDEYISEPMLLEKLIYLGKLKGTGTVIKIYYGCPDYIDSNVVYLTL